MIEPYAQAETETTLILDFSLVKVWDIAAVLWLIVALHHYRHNVGLSYLLRLPEGKDGMKPSDFDDYERSADYLRRWEFNKGLKNIASNVDSLLVPQQKEYFSPERPKHFYPDRKIIDNESLLQSLVSRRLVQIRNLSDPIFLGAKAISPQSIADCVRYFQSERIGDILNIQCGIEKRTADLFSDHLLTEALMNVQEHPNATIGLVAISLMGNTKELILSVVDNGDAIPQTIYPRYYRDLKSPEKRQAENIPSYNRQALPVEEKAKITNYATRAGVTRKMGMESQGKGMGLTYIKNDTVNTFKGKLRILTDGLCLKYEGGAAEDPKAEGWPHSWTGNLLRIAIPIEPHLQLRDVK